MREDDKTPTTVGAPDEEWKERAAQFARRLPRHAIGVVINEVETSEVAERPRARAFRSVLVEHFNRMRPLKARRLFTSLFEPLLVDDAILLRSREPVPGLIQRVDVGGVWAALTRGPLRQLAADVQAELDTMSRDTLIDRVFTTPPASTMRAAMGRETAKYLNLLLRDKNALASFLSHAEREAARAAQRMTPCLTWKCRIDADLLRLMVAVIKRGVPVATELTALRRDLREFPRFGSWSDTETANRLVDETSRALASLMPEADPEAPERWLAELTALHVKRRYDVVLRVIRDMAGGASAGEDHPLHFAAFAHFSASCHTIADTLRAVFPVENAKLAAPISLSRPVRELLSSAFDRFQAALALVGNAGLLSARSIGSRFRPLLAEITNTVEARVIPICVERARVALNSRDDDSADQGDVIWTLVFLFEWSSAIAAAGYAVSEIDTLRAVILRDAEEAHTAAVRMDPGDDPAKRMAHLTRINRVLGGLGESAARWANPMSAGMQAIVRRHLQPGRTNTPDEEFIVESFIAAVRSELAKSKHWRSAELAEIVEMYETRRSD